MQIRIAYILLASFALASCDSTAPSGIIDPPPGSAPVDRTQPFPLTDLVRADGVADTYKGFEGGLYFGTNETPTAHAAFGAETARQIQPLNASGAPDPDGAVVLMSISMSNATREWCHQNSTGMPGEPPCTPGSFMGQAAADPTVNNGLVIINGARNGQDLKAWDSPSDFEYHRVETNVLPGFDVTEEQVQIVWVKVAVANESSRPVLPSQNADAYQEEIAIGDVVRALRVRYPNLKQVFLTSRIYGGYSNPSGNSPEPWAFETGFGTKWAIEAQIAQRATGTVDQETGNLTGMPFMAWGPYIWSFGDQPRKDGLVWPRNVFSSDGIHPNEAGVSIVGDYLLDFFKTSPFTSCWFVDGLTCS